MIHHLKFIINWLHIFEICFEYEYLRSFGDQFVLDPSVCMLNGSFVKAVNLIEFNKLNVTTSNKVRIVAGDKEEDRSKIYIDLKHHYYSSVHIIPFPE